MNRTLLVSAAVLPALATLFAAPAYAVNGPFSGSYKAGKLILDDLVGRTEITVGGSDIGVSITGDATELSFVQITVENGALKIRNTRRERIHDTGDLSKLALYRIRVPQGTDLGLDGLVGEIQAGDTNGNLVIDGGALKGSIGAVKAAHFDGSGALTLTIGDIAGALDMDGSGATNIKTGNIDSAHLDVSGATNLTLQTIRHGMTASLSGASHVTAASVAGPVNVEESGVGNVEIAGGKADPLKVEISGFGQFSFAGEGVDPDLSVSGMGGIRLKSYSGKLRSDGGNIHIGD